MRNAINFTIQLLIGIFLFIPLAHAQTESVTGAWKGEWSNAKGHYFTFLLELRSGDSGQLAGEFTWKLVKSPRSFEQRKLGLTAIEYVVGQYDPNSRKLKLTGTGKDDPNLIIGIDVYQLKLSENGQVLEGITQNHGTWQGVFYGTRIRKKKPVLSLANTPELEGREIVTTSEMPVRENTVKLLVWDNKKEDGDIVSLNLNGQWILKDYTVKREKTEILLELKAGENVLVLHAENLGEIAPNTAAIAVVEAGKEVQSLVLNSDMGKSEAIKIVSRK